MMGSSKYRQLVYTVKDRCRVCYTCVRECPVKAIRIINGQAEVMPERCIGCGNCVKVCSQEAKIYLKFTEEVIRLLESGQKTIACLAPSFAAEFNETGDYRLLVGMLRSLGFDKVCEIAFGADLVAKEYSKLLEKNDSKPVITSDCPAVAYYIKHYYPELTKNLAPVVSPMVAAARVLKEKYGNEYKLVFFGPCIAKKAESDELDYVCTFQELREMFREKGISKEQVSPSEFDPPLAGKGAIFPVARGLLQNMEIVDDISRGKVLTAEGRVNFRDAIEEFSNELVGIKHLEVLACEGCIMGPGMSRGGKRYARRNMITCYVQKKMEKLNIQEWENEVKEFENIDLSQEFEPLDRRIPKPTDEEIRQVLEKMGKTRAEDHLNCGACGYDTCVEHAIAIIEGLAENEMCLPYSIDKLHASIRQLNETYQELVSTRQALRQSEKLASMGQLSAGIAHELNNPLGIITMYSNILKEEAKPDDPIKHDLELIAEQANRCKNIVSGLLNFARKNQVRYSETDLLDFVKHSTESVIIPGNISVDIQSSLENHSIMIDTDQMMQVLTNLLKNAVEAMPNGGNIFLRLSGNDDEIRIEVRDTGVGISPENMDKIFTPFFTTKKPGKGTGLGLPLIYGIIKMHRGKIQVVSNQDAQKGPVGTAFIITLPRKNSTETIKV